jgi:predicted lipoprotein with Yx(FWY)xxD motif
MSLSSALRYRTRRAMLPASVLGLVFVTACVADQPGISDNESGTGASAGTADSGGSTSQPTAGSETGNGATAGSVAAQGGGGASATEGGAAMQGMAGMPAEQGEGGNADEAAGGAGGAGTAPVAMACLFHTDAVDSQAGAGAGGAPSTPPATVVLQTNAFVGSYLTDAAGRTLYTYGGDLPGDCKTAPQSTCTADCVVSWPPFDAGARVLGAGLDDAAFGSIDRGDGTWQTTYYGWPLYNYKSDLALGQLTGQGKGKTWHAAELTPASVVILKAGTAKYLADGAGRTLYVSAADQVGTLDTDPVSACDKACLGSFAPFSRNHLSVVTSLEESDFSVFVHNGTDGLQLAYKGMPLYRARADLKSGDTTGLASAGFTAAVP